MRSVRRVGRGRRKRLKKDEKHSSEHIIFIYIFILCPELLLVPIKITFLKKLIKAFVKNGEDSHEGSKGAA